ncbi:MAG: hypothetical protein ACRC0J_23120, partial [Shewanella oncorhynchi]
GVFSGSNTIDFFHAGISKVVLTADNTNTGSMRVPSGTTLAIGNGGATGTAGNAQILCSGRLEVNKSVAYTLPVINEYPSQSLGALTIGGTGVITINTEGVLITTTLLAGATLKIDNIGGAIIGRPNNSSGTVTVPATATLIYNYSNPTQQTVSAAVSGAGAVQKTGTGILIITGSQSGHTGTTAVDGGELRISQAAGLGTGAVSVNSGGTLSYTLTTTGTRTVTVNAGGVVNRGGFAHTGTTFVLNGGVINP